MPQIIIDKLYAGKKYRIDINAKDAEDSVVNFPFIDISVPNAIARANIEGLIQQPPAIKNDVQKFNVPFSITSTTTGSLSFNQIDRIVYTSGAKASGKTPASPGTSVMTLRSKVGNFDGNASDWATALSSKGTIDIRYSGTVSPATASFATATYDLVDIKSGDVVVRMTITASVAGVFSKKDTGAIASKDVPFTLKAIGPKFSPIRNVGTASDFDGTGKISASSIISTSKTLSYSSTEGVYTFILNSNFNDIFINTPTLKDIVIPIWRYTTTTGKSKWYYCGIKNNEFYIPSAVTKSGNSYLIDTSNYYELTSTPRTDVKTYTGYDEVVANATFGQPTVSGTNTNLITNSANTFGPDLTTDIYLYEGFPKNEAHPIISWDIAFAVARYEYDGSNWIPKQWINGSNSQFELNTSFLASVDRVISAGNAFTKDTFKKNDTIVFNSGGTQ